MKLFGMLAVILTLVGCVNIPEEEEVAATQDVTIDLPDSPYTALDNSCFNHVAIGKPSASDQFLCREAFALGYNYTTKQADWVSYYLTTDSVSVVQERVDNFQEDAEIPVEFRSTLNDYYGSGYDRGHLAPRATVDITVEAMDESFLLSNISPQLPDFNRYGWADLEAYVRDCAVEQGELYVVTGPIYDQTSSAIGNGVEVPDSYFKVIFKPATPLAAWAYIIPHQGFVAAQIPEYEATVDQVEELTGLNFLSNLTDTTEYAVEANLTPACAY